LLSGLVVLGIGVCAVVADGIPTVVDAGVDVAVFSDFTPLEQLPKPKPPPLAKAVLEMNLPAMAKINTLGMVGSFAGSNH
jgi:hypothetical protein